MVHVLSIWLIGLVAILGAGGLLFAFLTWFDEIVTIVCTIGGAVMLLFFISYGVYTAGVWVLGQFA
jgi:hypothetical protein